MAKLDAREERLGWGLLAPALVWTLAFFLLPFLVMLALSFAHMEGRTIVRGFSPRMRRYRRSGAVRTA